jgi:protein-tyrosine-phosphatase
LTLGFLRVLVTDIHELAGLGTVRSLGRAGCQVIGAYPARAGSVAALGTRFLSRGVPGPDPWSDQAAFRAWLLDLVRSEAIQVLFPVSEASLVAAHDVAPALTPATKIVMPDEKSQRFSLSKLQATRAALHAEVRTPQTVFLCEGAGAPLNRADLDGWPFPYLVKTDNVALDDGSYLRGSTYRVSSSADLDAVLDRVVSTGAGAIAQRLVPGRGVGAFLLRSRGRVVLEFGHERLHEVPYEGGWSSLRRSDRDPRVMELARRLLTAIDYEGLAMVECRQTLGDEPYFLEINGRPWGSIALALHCGADFPRAALEATLGQEEATVAPPPLVGRSVYCQNLYPGEIRHLGSVVRAQGMAGDVKRCLILKTALEVIRYAADPRVRGDILWWSDPRPALTPLRELARTFWAKMWPRRRPPRARPAVLPDLPQSRRVLFLCSGNICRSPFAEQTLRALSAQAGLEVEVASAGLAAEQGSSVPQWFRRLYERFHVDWRSHRSRQVGSEDVRWADLVIVMEHSQRARLHELHPLASSKTWLISELVEGLPAELPDPYVAGPAEAVICFEALDRSVRSLHAAMLRGGSEQRGL